MNRIKIIAEIGINHDGLYEKAKDLIDSAADSGVDAIKFQYRNLDNLYLPGLHAEIGDEILQDEIASSYLTPSQLIELTAYARVKSLEVGVSFFNVEDAADFPDLQIFDFFKVPSVEFTNHDLLHFLCETKKHVYLSLGCQDEDTIELVVSSLEGDNWTLLHCVSNYPLSIHNSKLGYIKYLKDKWDFNIGYSSHDENWESCLIAMSFGANVIERHITIDKSSAGLDHSSSSTPSEFKKLCMFADNFSSMIMGCMPRAANQGELLNLQNLGRSYYARHEIAAGKTLEMGDLIYRSPNVGISNRDISNYVGFPVIKTINKNEALNRGSFIESSLLPESTIQFARQKKIAIPVRLHDYARLSESFPIGAYELHFSFAEAQRDLDPTIFNGINQYSIHLPDYIDSKHLIDPFSDNPNIAQKSQYLIKKLTYFAATLQEHTKKVVPVVGSFSLPHGSRIEYYDHYAKYFDQLKSECDVILLPQWLPPFAWYFGGSVRLGIMNQADDIAQIIKNNIPFCMDACHLILGRNYFGFDAMEKLMMASVQIKHIHIADAAGIDGEGLPFGADDGKNDPIFRYLLGLNVMKVIEVWQGHLDHGEGFRAALIALEERFSANA